MDGLVTPGSMACVLEIKNIPTNATLQSVIAQSALTRKVGIAPSNEHPVF